MRFVIALAFAAAACGSDGPVHCPSVPIDFTGHAYDGCDVVDCQHACDLYCEGISCPKLDCHDSDQCRIDCTNSGTCPFVDCRGGGSCFIDCDRAIACEADCSGAQDCSSNCNGGAQCLLHCDGAVACKFNDCPSPVSCPSNVIACNRPCPG